MQLKSLIIRDQFRDVVGCISLEELITNQRLVRMIIIIEALIKVELREFSR